MSDVTAPSPDVSVVVVHLGRGELLEACLASLHATARGVATETIVVDNRSDDPAVDAIVARHPGARTVRLAERLGYGAATNAGLRASRGRHVLWCNNDLVFQAGTVETLVRFLDAHPDYAVASPRLLNPDGSFQPSFSLLHIGLAPLVVERLGLGALLPRLDLERHWHGHEDEERDVAVGAGACCLIRRSALERIGGEIDGAFFLYAEEFDLCHRFWKAGMRVRYLPTARVVHLGGQTTHRAATNASFPFVEQAWRSKFRYLRKHYGRGAELAFAGVFVAGALGRAAATGALTAARRLAGDASAATGLRDRTRLHLHLASLGLRAERHVADRLPSWP